MNVKPPLPPTQAEVLAGLSEPEDQATLGFCLELLGGPDRLYRLDRVLENLASVLVSFERPPFLDPLPAGLPPDALARIEQLRLHLRFDGKCDRTMRQRTQCPAYAALSCRKEEDAEAFRSLLAHFTLALLLERQRREGQAQDEPWVSGHAALYGASLALRRLAKPLTGGEVPPGTNWPADLIKSLPFELAPKEFAASLLGEEKTGASEEFRRPGALQSFLRLAHGLRGAVHRTAHPSYSGRRTPFRPGFDVSDPDEAEYGESEIADPYGDDHGNLPKLGFKHLPPAENRGELLKADNCPHEFESEGVVSWGTISQLFAASRSAYKGHAAAQHSQIARHNKLFPFAFDRLLPHEIERIERDFRRVVEEALAEPAPWTSEQLEQVELRLIPLVMLWTGSPVARTVAARYRGRSREGEPTEAKQKQPPAEFDADLVYLESLGRFSSAVDFPRYRQQQPDAGDLDRQPRSDYFLIPDTAELRRLVEGFWARSQDLRKQVPEKTAPSADPRLFSGDPEGYYGRVRRLLGEPSQRITPTRLANALFNRVLHDTGKDVVAAAIIGGVKSPVCRVPMFYGCRSQDNIEGIYARVVTGYRRQLGSSLDPAPAAAGTPAGPSGALWVGESNRYIAVRSNPTRLGVQQLVEYLQDSLLENNLRNSEDRRRYHNDYTLYTVVWFGVCTARRAVIDPLIRVADISPYHALAFLLEKDTDSGTKGRFALIPRKLRRHLEFYEEHVSYLPHPDVNCFFLDDKWRPVVVSPSSIESHFPDFFRGFPSGFYRRFTFNELLEAGCPPEIVRIMIMGHAVMGEEAWSRNSTFDYVHARKTLEPFLTSLLDDLGFEPLRSRTYGRG